MAEDYERDRIAHLRSAIVRHLQLHPLAGDTPKGIVSCWLPESGYEDAPQFINIVIDQMVMAGELAPRFLPDGGVLYVCGPAISPLR